MHRASTLLLLAMATASFAAGIEEPANSKVHVLNYNTFKRFMKKNPLVLMEFYGGLSDVRTARSPPLIRRTSTVFPVHHPLSCVASAL